MATITIQKKPVSAWPANPVTLITALACVVPAALADIDETTTPEVVVTANRVETPANQVGSSVAVLTSEQLEQRQTTFVADALRDTPGVAVSRSGPVGALTQVRIRGAESSHTLVLIDGIEANDPALGSEFDFAHLLAEDVETVEILRGPQSALWGSDALGGVVNVITKKGSGPLSFTSKVGAGRYDTNQASASLGAGTDTFNYSAGLAYYRDRGINVADNGSEDDGYKNISASMKAGATPMENLSLDIVGRYTAATSESDMQDFSFPPGPAFGRLIDSEDETKVDQFYGLAQAKLDLFDGMWQQRVRGALTDTDNKFERDNNRLNTTDGEKLKFDYQSSLFFETPELANATHVVTLAAEREEEDFKQRGASRDAPENQSQETDNNGYVGEYQVSLWEQLFMTGSVRHDDNDRFENENTWRTTAAYLLPATETRLHGSWGKGVKNPTFTELFGFFPGTFIGNPSVRPEESRGYDIGVEQSLWGGRAGIDVTFFKQNLKDEILTVFDPDTFLTTVVNQSGTSDRKGLEVSGFVQPLQGLDVHASYTYTDAEDPDGSEEPRRPEHLASLVTNYRFPGDRAGVNVGIHYNGDMKDFNFRTLPSSTVTLEDYTLVNVRAYYNVTKKIRVFGRIENALDDDYEEVFGFNTAGRTWFMGVRAEI
jgi:vitamin B12 transporter